MKSRSILYALIALVVLVGLIFVFRNQNKPSSQTTSQVKEYSFVLKDKVLVSGADKMTVTEGDHVKITLSSDADWPELHLHGYEIVKEIKKDAPAVIEFTADKTGSYVLEVHFVDKPDTGASDGTSSSGNDLQISHLEVQPKQ
jgi:hypothetical protein